MASSHSKVEYKVPKITRKRKRSDTEWKQADAKLKRNCGQTYVSRRRQQVVRERKVGPPCQCQDKCYTRVGEENVKEIFKSYWGLKDHYGQSVYFVGCITEVEVKRSRVKDRPSRQTRNFLYTVKVGHADIKVCRKAFLSIHDITDKRVRNAMKKVTPTGVLAPDMCGRHTPLNKISEDRKQSVRNHINSLQTVVITRELKAHIASISPWVLILALCTKVTWN
ncbi:uncharacterized protein LOC143037202 [Oratosquilla oratoria]|uniref:uncharacterized protein LOC143037202 n=1 Tax=Oratosquilla oratoria TaxID=337810 RepID=UPI003F76CAA8